MHVLLYTTRSCSFCARAKQLLSDHGVPFEERPIDGDLRMRERLAELFGRLTMPYALIDGEPIGGLAELERMAADGELSG